MNEDELAIAIENTDALASVVFDLVVELHAGCHIDALAFIATLRSNAAGLKNPRVRQTYLEHVGALEDRLRARGFWL